MSIFWNLWIIVLTLSCIGLVLWVLLANRKVAVRDDEDPENRTTGHVYDGIEEYDNPLPNWWFKLFIGSIIFAGIYLVLYPGLGSFKGVLNWTSVNQLQHAQEDAEEDYKKSYAVFSDMSIEELVHDDSAMKMGIRLFSNNCAVCHGADGGGNLGFPNLTDSDWLYGGSPEHILKTLNQGRAGNMPAFAAALGEEKISDVTEYLLEISGQEHDAVSALSGAKVFQQNCMACHGADAKGSYANGMADLGAPNLTDTIWLYEGSREGIKQTLRNGRVNIMPVQKDKLRQEKIHVLAAYVYSLSFKYE